MSFRGSELRDEASSILTLDPLRAAAAEQEALCCLLTLERPLVLGGTRALGGVFVLPAARAAEASACSRIRRIEAGFMMRL